MTMADQPEEGPVYANLWDELVKLILKLING